MPRNNFLRSALALTLLAVIGTPSTQAQTALADLAGNYASTGPLTDTFGTGTWTYYASTAVSGGTLTALSYGTVGLAGNPGYGLPDGAFNVPGVSNQNIFDDGVVPATNQLAWHPGGDVPIFTLVRWTAGAGEAGTIRIEGTFSKLSEPGGPTDFHIVVNGVEAFAQTGHDNSTFFAFDLTALILAGDTVDFILGDGNDGFGGDESLISATLTQTASAIPEPSTYAILAGVVALGLVVMRQRKK